MGQKYGKNRIIILPERIFFLLNGENYWVSLLKTPGKPFGHLRGQLLDDPGNKLNGTDYE